MIGIYKITSPSGSIYVGKSKNIEKRWKQYKKLDCKGQLLINYSLMKYGVNNHKFEIIQECEENELDGLEYKWWEYYTLNGKKMLNCIVPKFLTIPNWVENEIKKQEIEVLKILYLKIELQKQLIYNKKKFINSTKNLINAKIIDSIEIGKDSKGLNTIFLDKKNTD